MPSDPNHQRTSQSRPGDRDLPDDLAALGEQLAADASRLAERYPSSGVVNAKLATARPQGWQRSDWRWPAAAALLMVAAGAWWAYGQLDIGRGPSSPSGVLSTGPGSVPQASRAERQHFVSADVPPNVPIQRNAQPPAHSQPVSAGPNDLNPPPLRTASEVELLRAQLQAYESVIEAMQEELGRRKAQQEKTDKLLDSLRRQVVELEQRIERQDR